MNNFIELNLRGSNLSLEEIDHTPYCNHLQTMRKKATSAIKRFKFHVVPHEIMRSEYPDKIYGFNNERVAIAFWLESLGSEVKV